MESSKGRYLGEGYIELPPKASTKTRLHELAHKKLGHEPGEMEVEEFADREIDAEKWAWETTDKSLTPRVGLPAVVSLVEDYDFSIQEALRLVIKRLKMKGIPVTKSGRKDLTRLAIGEF